MDEYHIKTDHSPARIVQLTDCHIGAEQGFIFSGISTIDSLARVIDAILEHESPDLVLATGDLAHDPVATAYQMLLEQLQRLRVPVLCLPGNHDDPLLMEQYLNTANVSTRKRLRVNDWLVLLLNTWLPGSHSGRLEETELQWLEQQLDADDSPVLIALHHHPVRIHSPWMDGMMLKSPRRLLALLDRYPRVRAVIWGHIHQQFEARHGSARLLGCPSTCVQFLPQSLVFQIDPAGAGYRSLTLADRGRFETRINRITY